MPQGHWVTDTEPILKECVRFYTELYTKTPHRQSEDQVLYESFLHHIPEEKMSYKHFLELNKPITKEELFTALSTMKLDKSPEGDGLTVEFYRCFWPLISDLVFQLLIYSE